jgi:hypothetical protein
VVTTDRDEGNRDAHLAVSVTAIICTMIRTCAEKPMYDPGAPLSILLIGPGSDPEYRAR